MPDRLPSVRSRAAAVAVGEAHARTSTLTAVGAVLTTLYVTGLLFRPARRIARLGVDSLVLLVLYAAGIAGLFAIAA